MTTINSEPLLLQCSPTAFLAGVVENSLNGYDIPLDSFPNKYFELKITIKGEIFNSSLNGELAKSLWEFEKSMRKAYALMLHGTDNTSTLTSAERKESALNFKVSKGSSQFTADLKPLLKSIGRGFEKMSDRNKLIAVAFCLGAALGYCWMSDYYETKNKELEIQEHAATQETILKAISYTQPFRYAIEESSDRIAKSVPEADSVTINQKTYSKEDIQKLNERAPRTKAEYETITNVFIVTGIERVDGDDSYKVKIKDIETNQPIIASLSSDKGLFSSLNIDANAAVIGEYIEKKQKVHMTLLVRTTKSSHEFTILKISPS